MNEHINNSVRLVLELNSLEDILNTFSQQQVKTTEVMAQIEKLRAQIPENILRLHDNMRRRGKRSVAVLRNSVCAGCHMRVPIGAMPALMQGNTAQTCQNCGRLLYVAATVATKAEPKAALPLVKRSGIRPAKSKKTAEVSARDEQAVLTA